LKLQMYPLSTHYFSNIIEFIGIINYNISINTQ